MKTDKNIDVIFRDGLRNYEAAPPIDVWDNISKSTTHKKRKYVALKSTIAIVLLSAVVFLSYEAGVHNAFQAEKTSTMAFQGKMLEADNNLLIVAPIYEDLTAAVVTENFSATPNRTNIVSDNVLMPNVNSSNSNEEVLLETNSVNAQNSQSNNRAVEPSISNNFSQKSSTGEYSIEELNEISIQMAETAATQTKENSHRWTLAAIMSPSYNLISAAQSSILSSEKERGSFSGGLSVIYAINDKVSIQSGLFYNSMRSKITGINAYTAMSAYGINDVRGVAPIPLSNSINRNLHYLEVPMYVRYKLLDTRLNFNLLGGLSSNILVGNDISFKRNGSNYTLGETENANSFLLSGTIGMGVSYGLSRKMALYIEPMAKYYLTPIANIYGLDDNRLSFGLFSGIAYTF